MDDMKTHLMKQNRKTTKFSLNGKIFLAKCVKCYDADTIHVVFHIFNQFSRFTCRLFGIDTAEIKSKDELEKKYAITARDYLRNLILDKLIIIKCGEFDKYGRLLVTLFLVNDTNELHMLGGSNNDNNNDNNDDNNASTYFNFKESINNQLIMEKFAYNYNGKTKKPFVEWCDTSIYQ
jgi:endonuclease YncB( thermonuclease family)